MNRKILAGTIAAGFVLVGVGTARADEPSPSITAPPMAATSTTSTTAPPPSTTSTTVAAAPAPAPAPAPDPVAARSQLATLVNRERTSRGLGALEVRGDVTDVAIRWSGSMAEAGQLAHNDAYFSPESRSRLGARVLGENVARAATIDQAHQALMGSEHHRDNILDARFAVVGLGAELRDGTWWVTEDFLEPRSTPSPSPSMPAPAPVAASRPAVVRAGSSAPGIPTITIELDEPVAESDAESDIAMAVPVTPATVARATPARLSVSGPPSSSQGPSRPAAAAIALLVLGAASALHRARLAAR